MPERHFRRLQAKNLITSYLQYHRIRARVSQRRQHSRRYRLHVTDAHPCTLYSSTSIDLQVDSDSDAPTSSTLSDDTSPTNSSILTCTSSDASLTDGEEEEIGLDDDSIFEMEYFHKAMEDLDSWMRELTGWVDDLDGLDIPSEKESSSSESEDSDSQGGVSMGSELDEEEYFADWEGAGYSRKRKRRLHRWSRPDHFRNELRVSPYTFDQLLRQIEHDPVFSDNSQKAQMPVEYQLAITLNRFGHYGNSIQLDKPQFLKANIRMPTPEEKEEAKEWVERQSCPVWHDGWCLVDGTLVKLYARPYWFGESYFDWKALYSLNLQIVSLPNCQIIDVDYGFTGSTHDASAMGAYSYEEGM
ncbi:hypothetical protein L218DRAFT_1007144 [Marasmius fiardii PR-910]|nr:hypothetical protein L218DRAFT_1007144 [Marasmius fiardii PR-910]